ncbi:TonB-dependent receptor [Pseudomonas sp. UM16]|uniref:TonB-dependent receptor n=1 Tax=Pseudomonas sp. UM16 TaxID=3158962 RepID=UPI00398FDDD2
MTQHFSNAPSWATTFCALCFVTASQAQSDIDTAVELTSISITATPVGLPSASLATTLLPEAPGGQVASGSRLGLLGNRDRLDTPFNVTGYTSTYIADSQARSIADVVAADPSVRVVFPRASYRDVYYIRGFSLFSYNMGLDGLYGIAPKQRYPAVFAERIEILKGPDTFVNGVSLGGSVGGAINIVPKRATDDDVTTLTTSYESNSELGTHVDVGRRFGEAKQFGIRFNGLVNEGDLTVDDQSSKLGATALSLDYQGDRLRLYGDFGTQRQKVDAVDWVATLAPGVKKPPIINGQTDLGQPWASVTSKDSYAALRGEYDLTDQWTAFTNLGISTTETTGIYVQPTNLKANGDYLATIRSFPSNGTSVSTQSGLRGTFDTGPVGHHLTLATAYWRQDFKAVSTALGSYAANAYNTISQPKPNTSAVADLDDIHNTSQVNFSSVALADTLSVLNERVQLTLGGRQQTIQSDSYAAQSGAKTSSYDCSAFSPALAVVFKLNDHLSLYGNYVEALQQGPSVPNTALNYGDILAPVVSRQVEAGIKADIGTWFTSLAAFQITQPNGITDLRTNIYSLDGEQRNRGLEWNISGALLSQVRILGGATLIDGRQTKTAGGVYDDKKAIGVPNYQANLGLEWDTPVPDLTLSTRVIRTDKQYVDAANTQSIDAWTRYDLGARYSLKGVMGKPVVLRVAVENVANTRYWASASTGQVSGISRATPRTLLLSSTFSF